MKIPELNSQTQAYNGGIKEDTSCCHATRTHLTQLPTCLRAEGGPKLSLVALVPSL